MFLACAVLLPGTASGQIIITNGVQRYASLASTTVTMSGKCELWVTNAATPITGCTINLTSVNAWLFLPGIKPSVAISSYLSQVRISGAAAVVDSNCRVRMYGQSGAVIIPYASSYQPLTVYSGPEFSGAATSYTPYTYYTGGGIGNFGSFKLKRGYQVVFAQTADGKNYSKCYTAQDADLEIGTLPSTLDGQVQFIYVTPWRWAAKKGIAGNPGIPSLNVLWWYDWNIDQNSTSDLEYVAIRQTQYWPSMSQNWQTRGINTVVGYNEPDSAKQANLSVSTAISAWGDLLGTGLRVGSPATTDGGPNTWLIPFVSQADAAGLRVDFVCTHYYQSHNPADAAGCASQLYNFLLNIWNNTHRPIWVTEWNNGANWTDTQWPVPTYTQQQACVQAMVNMLESTPFVERYALYNWVEDPRSLINSNNAVTPAGTVYSNTVSALAYVQTLPDNGTRGIAQYLFTTNAWDSSGFCNNGIVLGAPAYAAGHNSQAQAMVLDGTNNYVQLPANMAKGSAFTFAAWVYWNGGANWQRLFDFGNDTTHYLFLTPSSGSSTLRFAINNGSGEQRVEAGALAAGSWQHVAFTLNGGTGILYVNGVQVASSTSLTIAPSAFSPIKNYLGKSQFGSDPLFSGLIDGVTIKDYALSAAQIALLQTNQPPQFTNAVLTRAGGTEASAYSGTIAGTAISTNVGDTLSYSKGVGPAWLSVAANGTLSGTPTSGDGGTNYFTVCVSDTAGQNSYAVLAIPVTILTGSGTWTADASTNWSQTTSWSGNQVASGTNQTADFSTINITANRTVTLDSSRTIGYLKFSDTSGSQSWTLAASNGCSLKLDTGSVASPLLTVTNPATISAPLTGTNGFTKTGTGTLILSGNNPLTGPVYLDTGSSSKNDGVVHITGPDAIDNASLISIRNNNSGNSTLQLDGTAGNITINAPFTITYRNNGVITMENIAGTNVLNGSIYLYQGGNSFTVQSDAGLIVFTGTNQYVGGLVGTRTNYFAGSGNHLVVGPMLDSTNGSPISLAKNGSGRLTLAGVNTYGNSTLLNAGALYVDGTLPAAPLSIASGTVLGGNGVINAAVTLPANTTLIPGDNLGTLAVNNSVTLQPGSTTQIQLDAGLATNGNLSCTGTLTLGGTLVITNVGSYLTAGNSFTIFSAASITGSFATVRLPSLGAGLAWNTNNLLNGFIAVVSTVGPQFNATHQSADGNFYFDGTGAAGVTYELDAATNLAPPVAWSFVTNSVADQTGIYELWDLTATNWPQRFYRITSPY